MSDVQISPLAKRLAEENSIDWRKIRGTGPEGRVIERDILTYLARVMSGEADLPAEPDKSEPLAPANLPAAVPANMANFAAASAGLAKEGVDLGALIGGLSSAPVPSNSQSMPPLDFGSLAPAAVRPAPEPVFAPPPPSEPIFAPPPAPEPVAATEPVFEIELDDADDLVLDHLDIDSKDMGVVLEDAPQTVVTQISTTKKAEVAVGLDTPFEPEPQPAFAASEPAPAFTPEPILPATPEPMAAPVWLAPESEPVLPDIPVWSAPAPIEPSAPLWTAPEPEPVVSEPVPPVWSAPEPSVITEPEPAIPNWSAPEPVAVVVPESTTISAPDISAPELAAVAAPMPEVGVVSEPASAIGSVPSYVAPNSSVISDFFQLFAARSQFNPQALEDIRAQLRISLNNREIPNELFLARAAVRALRLLGLEKFCIARLEAGGLQAYAVNGVQHSFLEALQSLSRATPSSAEGLLVMDASSLGVDDLVLPSASGVLALGRGGKLTLSGNLPPLQSTEFLQKMVEQLEHPVGLVI
ncbi:MAG: E3 binding domain-containing protein [Deinococcales bacterium]